MNEQIITINNLVCYGHHGVFDFEREYGQPFIIDSTIIPKANIDTLSDDLSTTVDYGAVCLSISEYFERTEHLLLETVTEELSAMLLETYENIEAITILVKKPQAPIPLNVEAVGVSSTKSWHKVYVALGSNIGDSNCYLDNAIKSFKHLGSIRKIKESSRITTKPYGNVKQDDFLNSVVYFETYLTPEQLLVLLHEIEAQNNRERLEHWGPRTLDLDILFYDDEVVSNSHLCIPHVDLHNRMFVLEPMMELNPYHLHPVKHKRICELYDELKDK